MTYNKDTTIKVCDLVRFIKLDSKEDLYAESMERLLGEDGMVTEIDEGSYPCARVQFDDISPSLWLESDWLEVMTPNDELKSVYHEEKILEEKKDKCYELCKMLNTGYIVHDEMIAMLKDIFKSQGL